MISINAAVISILVVLELKTNVAGFNLAVNEALVYQGPRNSYFGYKVNFLKNSGGSWVLVGAPKSNSTYIPSSVVEPGALYKCHVANGPDSCSEVKVDDTPNLCMLSSGVGVTRPCGGSEPSLEIWHKKDNQWLGELKSTLDFS